MKITRGITFHKKTDTFHEKNRRKTTKCKKIIFYVLGIYHDSSHNGGTDSGRAEGGERTAENENGYQSPFALRDYLRNHDFLHVGYKGTTQKTPTHSRK